MEIYCINNKKTESFNPGSTYSEMFDKFRPELKSCPVCTTVNGKVTDMDSKCYEDCDVEFLDVTTSIGARS